MDFPVFLHHLLAESASAATRAGTVIGMLVALLLMVAIPVMFVVSLVRYLSTRRGGWLAGLLISGLLLVGGGALLAAGAWKGFQKASEQAKTPKSYTSTDGAVRIDVPSNWKDLPQLPEESTLRMGNLVREEYLVVVPESKADYPGTLEDASTAGVARIQSTLKDPDRSEAKHLLIGGRPAIQYELTGNSDEHRIVYLPTTVETAGSFQHILMWTLASKREVAIPIFQKVLESATFEDKPVVPEP